LLWYQILFMSMYIYHVNNGDDNLNGIICAWSVCLFVTNKYA
jgi:hypothetical protein